MVATTRRGLLVYAHGRSSPALLQLLLHQLVDLQNNQRSFVATEQPQE